MSPLASTATSAALVEPTAGTFLCQSHMTVLGGEPHDGEAACGHAAPTAHDHVAVRCERQCLGVRVGAGRRPADAPDRIVRGAGGVRGIAGGDETPSRSLRHALHAAHVDGVPRTDGDVVPLVLVDGRAVDIGPEQMGNAEAGRGDGRRGDGEQQRNGDDEAGAEAPEAVSSHERPSLVDPVAP